MKKHISRQAAKPPSALFAFASLRLCVIFLAAASLSASTITLSLSSAAAAPGASIVLNVALLTIGMPLPSALQWTLGYNAVDIAFLNALAGPVALAASKSLQCNAGAGSLICLVFGINAMTIANGIVATVPLTISPSTIHLSTVILMTGGFASDAGGLSLPATASGSTVAITQAATPVPEAATPLLIGLGLIAISRLRRR